MRLLFVKRFVVITGRGARIEDASWNGHKAIAKTRYLLFSAPLADIDHYCRGDLSSAIRTFLFNYNYAWTQALSADRFRAGMSKFVHNTTQSRLGALNPKCP